MRKLCKHCRNPFDPKRRNQQYCKPTCKQYAYLMRNGMELAGKSQWRKTVNDGNDTSMTHSKAVNDEIKTSMTEKPEPVNDATENKKASMTDNSNQRSVNDGNIMEPSITLSKTDNDTNPVVTLAETEKRIIPLSEQAGQKQPITDNPIPVSDPVNGECEPSMTGKKNEAGNKADQSMTLPETVNDKESRNPSLMPVQKHPDPLSEQGDIIKQPSITDAGIAATNNPVIDGLQAEPPITHLESTVNDEKSQNPSTIVSHEKINNGNAKPIYVGTASKLISGIKELLNSRIATGMDFHSYFISPLDIGWTKEEQSGILWINERLRCLLDSLLKVSHKRQVTSKTIILISKGFSLLEGSKAYSRLPRNYPYSGYISRKVRHLKQVASTARKYRNMKCSLEANQKVVILSMLYEIGSTVPHKKITELTF